MSDPPLAVKVIRKDIAGDADAGQPWRATEYVTGPSLADAGRRHGPLPSPPSPRTSHSKPEMTLRQSPGARWSPFSGCQV